MQPFTPGRPHWWQWPTILSLDAPAVALAWQQLLGRAAHVAPAPAEALVLGSSIWLAYAADRWIEGWRLNRDDIRTQRHYFYQRWRWPLGVLWCVVLGADLTAAALGLSSRAFAAGLILLAPVLVYLLSHQLVHRENRWRAPKEICVALLLVGGVAVFLVAPPGGAGRALAAPLLLFGLLCFANLALISLWERGVDEAHGQTSLALQFRRAQTWARALPWALAVVAAGPAIVSRRPVQLVFACGAASALLLGLIDRAESRIGSRLARVLADAALLTPLLPLLGGGRFPG